MHLSCPWHVESVHGEWQHNSFSPPSDNFENLDQARPNSIFAQDIFHTVMGTLTSTREGLRLDSHEDRGIDEDEVLKLQTCLSLLLVPCSSSDVLQRDKLVNRLAQLVVTLGLCFSQAIHGQLETRVMSPTRLNGEGSGHALSRPSSPPYSNAP